MKFLNRSMIAGLIALPLLFAGCASSTPDTPEQAKFEQEKKNIIIDNDLSDEIDFESIRRWETEHGLPKIMIRARVRSTGCLKWIFCSYETLAIAYRFAWYENGVEVETPTSQNWSILNVQYGEELGFNATSPNKNAKEFKLFIRKLTKENEAQFQKKAVVKKNESPVKTNDEKAQTSKKETVAKDVKVPPSTPTQIKKTQNNDEAEADAAAIRQAAPAAPAGSKK